MGRHPVRRVVCRLGLATVLLSMVACGSQVVPTAGVVLDGDWELASGTVNGGPLGPLDDARITLRVVNGEASGVSGCNHYFGTAVTDGSLIALTGLGGTDMACADPIMQLEADYLAALAAIRRASGGADRLILTGDRVELAFTAVAPVEKAALTGTMWVLESVISGLGPDGSAASPVGEPAYLEIRDDGSVIGSTGCRTMDGAYVLKGDTIWINEISMGPATCPPDVVAQDDHVVSVLGDGFVPEVAGDLLTVSDPDGSGLSYRAGGVSSAAPTIGSTWVLAEAYVDGSAFDLVGEQVTLVYDGNGFTGSMVCNYYTAEATLTGNTLELGATTVTEVYCRTDTLERAFFDALVRAETMDRVGDRLLLRGENAVLIFELADQA